MDNATLAQHLDELADLEELRGANAFKVRAYRRAATTLRELSEPASALRARGELGALDGFGEALVAKVGELLDTGELQALVRARDEVGMDVGALRRLPGVGPKLLLALRDEAGVRDLDDLEALVQRGKLGKVTGVGPKLEQRIRDALPLVRAALHAVRLDEARTLVERLGRDLDAVALADVRRWMPSCERLVLATPVATADARTALAAAGLQVDEVGTALAVRAGDQRVEVHRLDAAREGRKVIELTGPTAHVDALRERAASEGAMWAALQGSEADVYDALGLAFVPPECRDDPRALDLATGEGFEGLVTLEDVRADLQVHTTFSDGTVSPLAMARAAKALGHTTLGLTDHAGTGGIPSMLREDDIEAYVQAAREAGDEVGIQVLAGAEVEVARTGELTLREEALEQLDYVAAGIHGGLDLPPEQQTARYLAVVEHPLVSLLVHPTGRMVNRRVGAKLDLARVFAAAAEHGVVLEIDAHPARLDLDATLVRKALAAGCDIAIDTDAHEPAELHLLEYGVMTARKALVPRERVVNTWEPRALRQRLAR